MSGLARQYQEEAEEMSANRERLKQPGCGEAAAWPWKEERRQLSPGVIYLFVSRAKNRPRGRRSSRLRRCAHSR